MNSRRQSDRRAVIPFRAIISPHRHAETSDLTLEGVPYNSVHGALVERNLTTSGATLIERGLPSAPEGRMPVLSDDGGVRQEGPRVAMQLWSMHVNSTWTLRVFAGLLLLDDGPLSVLGLAALGCRLTKVGLVRRKHDTPSQISRTPHFEQWPAAATG